MKKEELLNEDFLKQFKNGEDLNSFIDQLRKRGVEQLLAGELDAHLGYEKHERSSTGENGEIDHLFAVETDHPSRLKMTR